MNSEAVILGGSRDFDFLEGVWRVSHRRLKKRNAGSDDWETFASEAETRILLDGLCNVEEHRSFSAHAGVAFRTYDRSMKRWAIYWVSVQEGCLQQPVFGEFKNGVGVFEGDDVDGGVPIRARYIWQRIHSDRPRWEQAFSFDRGQTWETNWVMDFDRIPA